MPIKIIINGALGKMGKTAVAAIAHEKDLELVAATTLTDDLLSAIRKNQADVVIDFTEPHCAYKNTQLILDANARPVIGTTGFSEKEIQTLMEHCRKNKQGAIIAPNFSIGAVLMMKYAKDAAHYFSDVEIIEYHHPAKKDAPSGTAKKTADLIAESLKNQSTDNVTPKKKAARGYLHNDIHIHSVRIPGIFAEQEVIFAGHGEQLIIRHNASDRNAMMPGLFLCCRKVMELDQLVYGMESLI